MPFLRPYADRHADPKGPGDERPTAEEVVRDENMVGALSNNVMLITGGNGGIGLETARALYLTGARVYITARDEEKGREVAKELTTDPQRPVQVINLELDSFKSIQAAARDFLSREPKLNLLINNAGVMATPRSFTVDGHETQFGTNHLGHFLLFQLLKPALLAAGTPNSPARVVVVSSSAHRYTDEPPFGDLKYEHTEYDEWRAYGRAKLANIYFANEIDRRYGSQHLRSLSLHPGSIKSTLQRHAVGRDRWAQAEADPKFVAQTKSPAQGAATTVWAAVGKEWANRGAVYLENVGEGQATEQGLNFAPGYSAQAFNAKAEAELWAESLQLCGLPAYLMHCHIQYISRTKVTACSS